MSSKAKIKLRKTLAYRLTVWYSSVFATFLFLTLVGIYLAIDSILDNRIDEDLSEDIEELSLLLETDGLDRLKQELSREATSNDPEETFFRLIHSNGSIEFSSDLSSWEDLLSLSSVTSKTEDEDREPIYEALQLPNKEYEIRSAYGSISDDLILHLGESTEEKHEILSIVLLAAVAIYLLILPIAACIGWITAKKAVRGIHRVQEAAASIKNGILESRATVEKRGDEVEELAETFNAMADQIRTLIQEMREMTDNIAHDLRSPLGRIRAIAEISLSGNQDIQIYRQSAADTLEECDRLLNMINMTLDVAEAEAGMGLKNIEKVSFSELVAETCELYEPYAEQNNIALQLSLEPEIVVTGNRHDLQRMVANIIDNALKYTPEGGNVQVNLYAEDAQVKVSIEDTGIGIPEDELPRVFERFFRCDQSRSKDGSGLGLSFSKAVAKAHGGKIEVASMPSKSSIFTVQLPSSA